jgi:hypothetical protein
VARAVEWRRKFDIDFDTNQDSVAGYRTYTSVLCTINPRETVTRVKIDGQLWRQSQTTSELESTYFQTVLFGVALLGSAFTVSPITPSDQPSSQSWMWWQAMPWKRVDPGYFNDDSYQRCDVHLDVKAQRISPSMGTASGKVWMMMSMVRPDILQSTAFNFVYGASVAVLLP